MQGSDPQGNFYASDIMSFRTPPAEETASLGTNVATLQRAASIAGVSSEFSASFAADNAIDDDPNTEWSSKGDGNGATLTVSLSEATDVTGFGLWTRTMGSSAEISRFEVENEASELFGPFEIPNAGGIYTFPAETRGQTFTFRVVDSSGGNTGVVAVEVYAPETP